jgi:hypothetical protein
MKKLIGVLMVLALTVSLSLYIYPDEVEKSVTDALNLYKNGKNEEAIKSLSNALMIMHNKRELEIKNVHICTAIVGYGNYKEKGSTRLAADEPFMLYFEVEGYGVEKKDGKYWFWLSEDGRLTNQEGEVVFERNDFLNYNQSFTIPIFPFFMQNRIANIPAGKYKYEFTVKDRIKKTFVSGSINFEVMPAAEEKK